MYKRQYLQSDADNGDGDGFGLRAELGVFEHYFVQAEYSARSIELDFAGNPEIDLNFGRIGAGGFYPLDEAGRVAVYGGSYGGYMVLASAVHYSDQLKAAVNIVGISSFVTFLENTQDYRRDLRRVEYGDERIPEMREFLNSISPLNNVDKINVPMFVVQGQNDPRVPVTEADQIVAALEDKQQTVWYMNALNEGHGYRKKENRDVYQQAVILFFQKFLIPQE